MSLSWIFATLVKLSQVAPQLWPLVTAWYESTVALVNALREQANLPALPDADATPRMITVEDENLEKAIAEINANLAASGQRAIGDGAILRKIAALFKAHPELATALGSLLTGMLFGK